VAQEPNIDLIVADRQQALDQELRKCLRQINSQIEEIRTQAVRTNTAPVTMRDSAGDYIWGPLVIAKAQILHSLVMLDHDSNK